MTDAQLNIIAHHFVAACLWADKPEGTNPRPTWAAIDKAQKIVRDFVAANAHDVSDAIQFPGYGDRCAQDFGGTNRQEWPLAAFGHDLYLTSQGHGVGFWDRGLGDLGDRLTEACKALNVQPEFYRGWLNFL